MLRRNSLRSALRPALSSALNKLTTAIRTRFSPNFNGVNSFGRLQNRAINPDGDNVFEFWSPAVMGGTIMAQSISNNISAREFHLFTDATTIGIVYGGTITHIMTTSQGFKVNTRYGLSLIGGVVQLFEGGLGGALVRTGGFNRGAAREPTAQTLIGCRGNGAGSFAGFFSGLQHDVRINGARWPMGERNQTIQPSTPPGNNMTLFNVVPEQWREIPL
jgi:hypothetical protein